MEELNIRELRERLADLETWHRNARAIWKDDGHPFRAQEHAGYAALLHQASDALLSSAEAREEAQARVADWTERLQAICEQASCPPGLNRFDFIANRLAALQSAEARAREAEGAWAWLTERPNLSLEHYSPIYGDDDDDAVEWRVHRESGNINDREWELVGAGPTALAAVQAARQALGASHG